MKKPKQDMKTLNNLCLAICARQRHMAILFTVLIAQFLLLSLTATAQRQVINLKSWEFSHDKESWEQVQIPHDWAISGPFDKKWDLQTVRIVQNGEKVATEKSGRSGSLPWIGK